MRKLACSLLVFVIGILNSSARGADVFYVTIWEGDSVRKYDSLGNYYPLESLTSHLSEPRGIAIDGQGNIFVANRTASNVVKFDRNGQYLGVFASGFTQAVGLIFDSTGNLYVSDIGDNKIYKFDANGSSFGVFADQNLNGGEFMAFDSTGRLYVSNFHSNSVSRYDQNGNPLGFFISSGLQNPRGIFLNSQDDLFVANWTTGIRKFDTNGSLTQVITDNLNDPMGLTRSPNGEIYVSNLGNNTITRYQANGNYIDSINTTVRPWQVAFSTVPEPSTYILCTLCVLCIVGIERFQRKRPVRSKISPV